MASRGASLFAFFFCNEKKKGGFGAPPQELLHKPKDGAKGLKFGKLFAIKRKQKAKCYFAFCALKSPLTNSRKYKKAGRGLEQQLFSPFPVEVKPIILGTPKTLALHKIYRYHGPA